MLRRFVTSTLAAVGIVSLLASSGCFTPEPCKPGDACDPLDLSYRPLTTPYAPLYNLALAYSRHDITAGDQYATLFDPTLYQFIWDDPAEPGLDNYYGYNDEVDRTRRMFSDPDVASINLTFLTNASDSIGVPSNVVGDPLDTQRFTVNGISLTLDRPPTQYVTNGTVEFFVAKTDTVAGVPQWRIIRWRDRTVPPTVAPSLQNNSAPSVANGSALMRAAALADEKAREERNAPRSTS